MTRYRSALAVMLLLAGSVAASAQTGTSDRWSVSVNGGYRIDEREFQDSVTFTANAEEGRFNTDYTTRSGPSFDVSGGVLLRPKLGIGVGVSRYHSSTPVTLDAAIPHPFYFGQLRSVSGDVSGLSREELGVHIQVRGVFPVSRRVTVTLFGGPSFFQVSQDLMTRFSYSDAYPYDEVTFRSGESASSSESTVGVNAGGDVAYYFSTRVGLGFTGQFVRANVDLPSAGGGEIRVRAGGVSTGAGLRFRF